jgi:tetratricopeptide (TPR) repeat protein
MNVIRSTAIAGVLGVFAGLAATYHLTGMAPAAPGQSGTSNGELAAAVPVEAWPICSAMASMAETADWAALDPDFAAGKRAIVAGDWNRALAALTSAALRDTRNADIQNYLGYVHRRLHQIDRAMRYYERALALNPRHRSAHEHLGEAYLVQGAPAEAKKHLAQLEQICLFPCQEYDDLKQAITEYGKLSQR